MDVVTTKTILGALGGIIVGTVVGILIMKFIMDRRES